MARRQLVVVEAWVPGAPSDAHPSHPIYYPEPIPPDVAPPEIWGGANEPFPTPPIYLPVPRPPDGPPLGIWGGANEPFPTPPIYLPSRPPAGLVIWGGANETFPTPPIYIPIDPERPELPDLPPWNELPDEVKQKVIDFLTGNLPPNPHPPPDYVAPV